MARIPNPPNTVLTPITPLLTWPPPPPYPEFDATVARELWGPDNVCCKGWTEEEIAAIEAYRPVMMARWRQEVERRARVVDVLKRARDRDRAMTLEEAEAAVAEEDASLDVVAEAV